MLETTTYKNIPFRYHINKPHLHEPPILFIGGTFQTIETTIKTEALWMNFHKTIIIELPGFGPFDILPDTYGLSFLADCVKHVLDICRIDRCFAYGYSYGTGPVYKCAAQNQDRFTAILLGGSSVSFTAEMTSAMQTLIDAAKYKDPCFSKLFLDTFYSKEIHTIDNGRFARLLLTRLLRSLTDKDLDAFAANYTRLLKEHTVVDKQSIPTHVFNGEHDAFNAYKRLPQLHSFCSNLTISKIGRCDHFYHLQRPDAVDTLINNLLHAGGQEEVKYAV